MIKNIKDLQAGDQVSGLVIEIDNVLTERPFTWGVPWTVLAVDISHIAEAHVYRGVEHPARTVYRVEARAASGEVQSIGIYADNEGLILAEES